MELRELEAFVKVTVTGSFTKAAEQLSLTQPAVTRQVAALERELGARLFNRLGRRAETTNAGAVFYDYAIRILGLAEESYKAVADVAAGLRGTLSIGASSTTATYLLPSVLKAFTEQFPNVKLSMFTGPTARVTELVATGSVDLAIVMEYQERQGIASIALANYELVVIVSPNHPLASRAKSVDVESLAREALIVMQPGATLRRSVESIFVSVDSPLRISMELDNVESIKKMVEAELGVSIVPEIAARSEAQNGSLVLLALKEAHVAIQTIWAVHDTGRYQSAAAKQFLALLQARLAEQDDAKK